MQHLVTVSVSRMFCPYEGARGHAGCSSGFKFAPALAALFPQSVSHPPLALTARHAQCLPLPFRPQQLRLSQLDKCCVPAPSQGDHSCQEEVRAGCGPTFRESWDSQDSRGPSPREQQTMAVGDTDQPGSLGTSLGTGARRPPPV